MQLLERSSITPSQLLSRAFIVHPLCLYPGSISLSSNISGIHCVFCWCNVPLWLLSNHFLVHLLYTGSVVSLSIYFTIIGSVPFFRVFVVAWKHLSFYQYIVDPLCLCHTRIFDSFQITLSCCIVAAISIHLSCIDCTSTDIYDFTFQPLDCAVLSLYFHFIYHSIAMYSSHNIYPSSMHLACIDYTSMNIYNSILQSLYRVVF